ncbi:CERK [Cordylochernes scorpioides]|uniref:CERK n=1 Tax=Cordylochernes scorpioides TaxID=51811 RepID=A0ABY6LEU5_9ARAC|nr:CERK [Cordylochernes scorpioides]
MQIIYSMQISKTNGWVTVRGQFMAVNVATMSCRCGISREGIAPSAHLGDGCADVILVNQCSRWDFLRYLLRISLHNSSPVSHTLY